MPHIIASFYFHTLSFIMVNKFIFSLININIKLIFICIEVPAPLGLILDFLKDEKKAAQAIKDQDRQRGCRKIAIGV